MEMTILALCLGVVPLLGWLLWWWNDLWYGFMASDPSGNTKLPPGHMGFPIVGDILHFLWYFKVVCRPEDYINSKRKKYGDGVGMYRSHLFGTPCIIACSPSATKFVFQSDQTFTLKWPKVDLVGEHSIQAVQGPAHARLRTFLSKNINQPDALRKIAFLVQPHMIAPSNPGPTRMTFENIGKYFASIEPGPILDALDKCFVGLLSGVRASPINIPGTAYHYGLQCRKKAVSIFREELEKRKTNQKLSTSEPINDLLDGLMKLKDDEGRNLSEMEVLDNIVTLLVAGYKTTAVSSIWAMYYLAKYPNVLHKLREETMSLRSTKKEEFLTSDDMFKLKYTNKVVDEILRLANVAPFVFRTATKDVKYKGYKIPKGWKVIPWIRYLHMNPDNFKDPMCFDPERWDAPMSPGICRVFGGGSRICAGNMLGRLKLAVFLYYLATRYKWELVNPNAKFSYLSHPQPVDGVEITIKKFEIA